MKNLLKDCGYLLVAETGIWSKEGFLGIDYSDGEEVENRIGAAIKGVSDLRVLSDAMKPFIIDWPSLYHLGAARANILRPFREILEGADTLEIGAGCGAITRYLGECGARVLALEGSPRRAAIGRSRTRDLLNVEVVADKFDLFSCTQKFDVITLIGVLEYANKFTPGENPALTMLARIRSMLKANGKLIIAIENQLGLKYFAGAPEDHLAEPMYGLEGRYRAGQAETYGRKVLEDLLLNACYEQPVFLSPLPDYKFPVSIVTTDGFASADFDSAAFASQSVRRDPQLPIKPLFSPELVWPVVARNGIALDLANSFLIVAGISKADSAIDRSALAYHYSTDRIRRYCKETIFRRHADGSVFLQYRSLAGEDYVHQGTSLKFGFPAKAEYVRGKPMAVELIDVVTRDDWSIESIGAFLRRYLAVLSQLNYSESSFPVIESIYTELPGECFDLTPQNLIRDSAGVYNVIDREWELVTNISVGWLLFRVLLLLTQVVTRFGSTVSTLVPSRIGFFLSAIQSAGFAVNESELHAFADMEASVQAEVTTGTFEELSNWWADSPLPLRSYTPSLNEVDVVIDLANAKREVLLLSQQLSQQIASRELLSQELSQQVAAGDLLYENLAQQIVARDEHISSLKRSLKAIRGSKSWKITAPLRLSPDAVNRLLNKIKIISEAVNLGGGLAPTLRTSIQVLKTEGLEGICWRISNMQRLRDISISSTSIGISNCKPFLVTPYYLDPIFDKAPPEPITDFSFAVHIYCVSESSLKNCLHQVQAIYHPYDLYISIAEEVNVASLKHELKSSLHSAKRTKIMVASPNSSSILTLFRHFSKEMVRYDGFAHFNTLESSKLTGMGALLGPEGNSGGRSTHLIDLVRSKAKLVFSGKSPDSTNIALNHYELDIAKKILRTLNFADIDAALAEPKRCFSAFFARTSGLRDLLALPPETWNADSVSTEAEVTLLHVIEQLLPILASREDGRVIKIMSLDDENNFPEFENQKDFSSSLIYPDVKVLSYYLPQFHQTPENDKWHGKGFTEWTKVRGANPLFEGHYQQHIPHSDIGYYLLDSPDTLRQQAAQMRQAGVHGQVFYHYWFSGRLVLEKPAQMLLAHPGIAMPFCFCWANENWTRRWDGNDRDILLSLTYSDDDARAFIRYLIPFFRDPRYIRVGTRPVLLVYRPSSIPKPAEYLQIWTEECQQAGIDAPYVVAVLTRGATNPADFEMDAGVERPLHDWTDGGVPDIRPSLQNYWPMNGSVLSYEQVRDFYMTLNDKKNFDYFRSNIPMWDNTARYGSEALLLHGSEPQSFQQWMEHSISDAQNNLAADRRFVVVNAWNEWAEGAHLEPDTRYGYSYLNSVGRALSGLPYAHGLNSGTTLPDELRLHVYFLPELVQQLNADAFTRYRFFRCLTQSRILRERAICVDYLDHAESLPLSRAIGSSARCDLRIEFRRTVHFAPDVIEHLVQTALVTHSVVICNDYGRRLSAQSIIANGAVRAEEAAHSSIVVSPSALGGHSVRECRMRSDAWCFELHPHELKLQDLPLITTILRFHSGASLAELLRAISCLYVMQDCRVIPLIAAQDLNDAQASAMTQMLRTFDWHPGCEPIVDHYASPNGQGDLRSRMLNASLRKVKTKYAAFLDYDDLLLPDAYTWLVQRLLTTGKAIAFGRVYWTHCSAYLHAILQRHKTFEYGGTYDEFLRQNHAPIHSMMIDLENVDRSKLIYFEDQRFMEDYLMTLQLVTEKNADWLGLAENHYVGDYVHSVDREHTLALNDNKVREALFHDPEYLMCENRIAQMRREIRAARNV